jgi:hypothetical protein
MLMQDVAWFAAALVFACFFMKTIVPLRTVAIASNAAFIGYALLCIQQGIFDKVLPILVLHLALLPLNLIRLYEVTRTLKSIRSISQTDLPYDFLIPFMKSVSLPAGEVIFHKGEKAGPVYILRSGGVRLNELNKSLSAGAMFGEIAVFSDTALRTATAQCVQDSELYYIGAEKVLELFYQDRRFSFKIARLLAGYATLNPAIT